MSETKTYVVPDGNQDSSQWAMFSALNNSQWQQNPLT